MAASVLRNFDSKRLLVLAVVLAITLAAAVLTLNRLGATDVCGSNEAVEGVFLQQMVEHGAMLFPLENGHAPMYKPPLFHWSAAALDRLAGAEKVTAFNLRLPAALYAVAGAALTMAFAWDFLGGVGAALAGLILCGSYQYIEQGRIGRVDMTLCFFEALALFAFMWWYAPAGSGNRRGSLRYLFALALGLGVLSKGPVGAILPAAACGIFLLVHGRYRDLARIAAPGPVLTAIVVGGSWYAACLFAHRYGFLDRQLGSENFGRFFGMLGAMPPWYYLQPILLNSAPFSLLVPIAVYAAMRSFRRDSGAPAAASQEERAREA
ncbi:MAG TPA: glycosyltransferase family 39 protein, partial [Candidatus Binataceae bacterium]|nr:glycosyltransferase family 39 protein [Candidatus Binataceae bacterium]